MDNPFLALFEDARPQPTDSASKLDKPPSPKKTDVHMPGASRRLQRLNHLIENIFLFTINPYGLLGRQADDPVKSLVFLQVRKFQFELSKMCGFLERLSFKEVYLWRKG